MSKVYCRSVRPPLSKIYYIHIHTYCDFLLSMKLIDCIGFPTHVNHYLIHIYMLEEEERDREKKKPLLMLQ